MKKFSSNYSQLSHLILKLPDAEQASLLEIAQKKLEGKTLKSISEKPKNALTVFASGIFAVPPVQASSVHSIPSSQSAALWHCGSLDVVSHPSSEIAPTAQTHTNPST